MTQLPTVPSEAERLPKDALLYVLMGPSGVGKSMLARSLTEDNGRQFKFELNRAWRTRPQRPGSDDPNIHCTVDEFVAAEAAGSFLFTMPLYKDVAGMVVPRRLPENTFWVYIYLPQHALRLREFYPNARFVQILPDDTSVLRERLLARDPDIMPGDLEARLDRADDELRRGKAVADLTFINHPPLEQAQTDFYDLIARDIQTRNA